MVWIEICQIKVIYPMDSLRFTRHFFFQQLWSHSFLWLFQCLSYKTKKKKLKTKRTFRSYYYPHKYYCRTPNWFDMTVVLFYLFFFCLFLSFFLCSLLRAQAYISIYRFSNILLEFPDEMISPVIVFQLSNCSRLNNQWFVAVCYQMLMYVRMCLCLYVICMCVCVCCICVLA